MRVLAFGDIHGCLRSLDALLDAVTLTGEEMLVPLGDFIDRGPNSAGVLERFIQLDRFGAVTPLLGNHEEMLLAARDNRSLFDGWIASGGDATLRSYGRNALAAIPPAHWAFLENRCQDYYETETHIFVHGCIEPELPMDAQVPAMLRWAKFFDPPPHVSGKILVCGHTRQQTGLPRHLGHAVCIDTGAYAGGWLTCLEAATGRFWQANESGTVRDGFLDDVLVEPDDRRRGPGPN